MSGRLTLSGTLGVRAVAVLAAGLLGTLGMGAAGVVDASASTTGTVSSSTALVGAFAAGRAIPASAVGAIRPGSLRVATSAGVQWASADLLPAAGALPAAQAQFQDGAGAGVFREASDGTWALVGSGPKACATQAPPVLQAECSTPVVPTVRPAGTVKANAQAQSTDNGLADAIVRIATSQVGTAVTPTVTNFGGVNCDPYTSMVGPPYPNDNGCGFDQHFKVQDQNEDWCSDFAKWVWEQAGVTADLNLINAGATSYYTWGQAQGQSLTVDPSTPPAVGDAVVFYPAGDEGVFADHVGIVTGVNPDGTINMVNGDFLGTSTVSVQNSPNIDLPTWSSQNWGAGEQWVYVAPPTARQQLAPQVSVSSPSVAVSGTSATFRAQASVPGATISSFAWAFADSQYGTAIGATVTHVFADPGMHTVAVTVTSSTGTVTTRTMNVDVIAPSTTVSSTPHGPEYYTVSPVHQQMFLSDASGFLAQELWDGTSWSSSELSGVSAPGGAPAVLTFNDASDTLTPHLYFDSKAGALNQAVESGTTWASTTISGTPEKGGPVVAALQPNMATVSPDVYYVDATGQLAESRQTSSGWQVQGLPGRPATGSTLSIAQSVANGAVTTWLVYVDATGHLTATVQDGNGWRVERIPGPYQPQAGPALVALTDGVSPTQIDVFFTATNGRLVEATRGAAGGAATWTESVLPGSPRAGAPLQAANFITAANVSEPQVFYVDASSDQVGHTFAQGALWASESLPVTADAVIGVGSYPLTGTSIYAPLQANEPLRLYFTAGQTVHVATSTAGSGTWTITTLPGSTGAGQANP
jgi:hypothetical protein